MSHLMYSIPHTNRIHVIFITNILIYVIFRRYEHKKYPSLIIKF